VKIGKSVKSVGQAPGSESQVRTPKDAAPAGPAASGDKVELSSLSAALQQAEAAMAETPIVDQGRVDEIKQAMSDGNFKVDAEKVADGLIESAREVLEAQPRKA